MKLFTANAGKSRFAGGKSTSVTDLARSGSLKHTLDEMKSVFVPEGEGTGKEYHFKHFVVKGKQKVTASKLPTKGAYCVILRLAEDRDRKTKR